MRSTSLRAKPAEGRHPPDDVKTWVAFGAIVRAAQYLVLGVKSAALTNGALSRDFDDIRALAHPVLRTASSRTSMRSRKDTKDILVTAAQRRAVYLARACRVSVMSLLGGHTRLRFPARVS